MCLKAIISDQFGISDHTFYLIFTNYQIFYLLSSVINIVMKAETGIKNWISKSMLEGLAKL